MSLFVHYQKFTRHGYDYIIGGPDLEIGYLLKADYKETNFDAEIHTVIKRIGPSTKCKNYINCGKIYRAYEYKVEIDNEVRRKISFRTNVIIKSPIDIETLPPYDIL